MLLVVICLISLLISIPGFIHKAGHSIFKGLIPGYNLYLFLTLLEISPILLILLALGLILLPDRAYVITLICVFLPFVVNDAYGNGKLIPGVLTLALPFVMYPFLAYVGGTYSYDVREEKVNFIKNNKILCIVILLFSGYMYINFTRLIEDNPLVEKDSIHYTNDIYMSDGRIYNNYLSDKEKKMYRHILSLAKKAKPGGVIDMEEFGCSNYEECGNLVIKADEAILVDHPELMTFSRCGWSYTPSGGFKLKIYYAKSNLVALKFGELKTRRIIDEIKKDTKDMTDLEKIYYVYEWMGKNNKYDYTFMGLDKNQSIYNVFMKNNAVCAGFAKASQVIFQNIGINAYGIVGESTGPHMWNVVEYDGKYYFYDSTVAACIDEEHEAFYNGLSQEYMNTYTIRYPDWYPEIEKENGLAKS